MGADAKMIQRLFGDQDRAVAFANVISEVSKERYNQFAYMSRHDEAVNRRLTTADEEISVVELGPGEEASDELRFSYDTEVFRKYLRQKAGRLGVTFEELQDMLIEGLGHTAKEVMRDVDGRIAENIEELESVAKIADEGKRREKVEEVKKGVAAVVKTYNLDRGGIIRSELGKKRPSAKWRLHMGSLFRDMARDAFTPEERERYADASPTVKYFGVTPTTRSFLETLTDADAERIKSWAEPRAIEALKYQENQKDLLELAGEIQEEGEGLKERGEEKQGETRIQKGRDIERILNKLFASLEERAAPRGRPGGAAGRGRPEAREREEEEGITEEEERAAREEEEGV